LRDSIRAATESLEILEAHQDLYANLTPDHYVQYEEIQTLREVSSSFEPGPPIQVLRSLLSGGDDMPTSGDLSLARKFFRALESRALHHYNDPILATLYGLILRWRTARLFAADLTALYAFIESVAEGVLSRRNSAAYSPAAVRFFDFVSALASSSKNYLEKWSADDSEEFEDRRGELGTIRATWREFHKLIKPALDADTLQALPQL